MMKFTLIGLNRQTFDFSKPQHNQLESLEVIATSEREALIIGRKTHACTVACIRSAS